MLTKGFLLGLIEYYLKKNKEIKCVCYNKIEVKYSDHRPVYAIFEINMNKNKNKKSIK